MTAIFRISHKGCIRSVDRYYAAFVRDLDGNRIEAVTFLAREN